MYTFKCALDAWWENRCVVPTNESQNLSGRNSEFSNVGTGRKTLTFLIRIEIVEEAGHAHSSDSELARQFVSNGIVAKARREEPVLSASAHAAT
jgi:hypothetical protein